VDKPIVYSYERVPTLRAFALDDSRVRGVMGPFGSGKSSACLWEIIRRAQQQRRNPKDGIRYSRWAIVRNTYPQLRDTTIKTVLDWLPERLFGQFKVASHDYIITGFQGCHIELMFRALDNPEHVKNLLSLELTGAWINEAKEVPKDIIDAIDGRINRYPAVKDGGCTWCGIIMDTNPPDEQNWWYKTFEEQKPEDWAIYKQPSGLSERAENLLTWEEYEEIINNPDSDIVGGLPPDYYTQLAKGKSTDYIRVFIEGNYGLLKAGKPVYEKSYNDDVHCTTSLEPLYNQLLVVGMDFGLDVSAVFTQLSYRGRLLVLEEIPSDYGVENFIKYLLMPKLNNDFKKYKVVFVGDPSGINRAQTDERTCFDVFYEHGLNIIPAKSNALAHRIGSVEYFLNSMVEGKPAFIMNGTKCPRLRKGFMGGYAFKKVRGSQTKFTDLPDKNEYSHLHDALQYAASYNSELIQRQRRPKSRPTAAHKPAIPIVGY
jgi:PBSX family phage terminase large subunit